MDLLCIAGVGTVFLSGMMLWLLMRRRKAPSSCPHCQSDQIGETNREPTGMRHADISGGGGGGYASTQVDYILTYRCNACRHTWTRALTETR